MRKMLRAVPVAGLALAAVLAPIMGQAQSFGIRPGAWENTMTVSGLTIPPEVLAKMPSDKRALVEQQLSANGGGQPRVRKRCVKQEDIDRGFTPNSNSSCKIDVVSRTSTHMSMTTTCASPASTGTMDWEAKTPEQVVGNIDQDVNGRKVHISVLGKWLGASCDGIAGG